LNIDVSTTVKVVLLLVVVAAIILLVMAARSIKAGRKLLFYQKRQVMIYRGWRLILFAVLLVGTGFLSLGLVSRWSIGTFRHHQRLPSHPR